MKGGAINGQAPATIVVNLPADARLTVDDEPTESTGELRVLVSPDLPFNREYHYTLKAEAVRGGQRVNVEKRVAIRAGQKTPVTLTFPTAAVAGTKPIEISKHPKQGYGYKAEQLEQLSRYIPGMKSPGPDGAADFRFPTDKELEDLEKRGLIKIVPARPGDESVMPARQKKTID
jgi:uncharacterized protein (TIGR03000 family)